MSAMTKSNKQGYRGYVSSRSFGGYAIPVPVQSLVLRDYCERKKFTYVLPVNENKFEQSYLVLEGMIQNLADFQGVLMCSFHMLPVRSERRRGILEQILRQGCSVHFVLEGIVIETAEDIDNVEELIQFAQLARAAPPAGNVASDG